MPTPTSDLLLKRVKEKGWLSISTIFFDNTFNINVFNTQGSVAISKEAELIFCTSPVDTQNSANIAHNLVTMYDRHNELRQNGFMYGVTVVGFDCLQHFDAALYTYGENLGKNEGKKYGFPKVPTPAQLKAMVKDPVTGLYPNTDTAYQNKLMTEQYSVFRMYDDKEGFKWAGARVDEWKEFYDEQEKFAAMIKAEFGFADVI